jgi:hypothetical protein
VRGLRFLAARHRSNNQSSIKVRADFAISLGFVKPIVAIIVCTYVGRAYYSIFLVSSRLNLFPTIAYVQTVISTGKYHNKVQGEGGFSDISYIFMFYWFEPVLNNDPIAKFPETIEWPGYHVGFADNVGGALTFKIFKNDSSTV